MNPGSKLWYRNIKSSPLSPPSYVFGIVWPILYFLMFLSALRIWQTKQCINTFLCTPLVLFGVHLIFNFSWTTLFFSWKRPDLALADILIILGLLIVIIKRFYALDKYAAYLLYPYFAWLVFAAYLNAYIVLNN